MISNGNGDIFEMGHILWWPLFVCGLLFTMPYLANNYHWWVLSHLLAARLWVSIASIHICLCVCVCISSLNGFKAIYFIVIKWMNHRHTNTHKRVRAHTRYRLNPIEFIKWYSNLQIFWARDATQKQYEKNGTKMFEIRLNK